MNIEQGGKECPEISTDLLGGSTICNAVRVRYMGPDAANEEGVGWIPPQGGPQADGAATTEETGQRLGLPQAEGCNERGRFTGGGYLYLPKQEHSCAVNFNKTYNGPLSSREAEDGSKGGNTIVLTRGFGFLGDADGDPGREADG